jgi:drug/metabolite transporter (DMT)-like permease
VQDADGGTGVRIVGLEALGALFALTTAFAWAGGVIFFKRSGEYFSPIALNFFKNTVAFVLFLLTLPLIGQTLWIEGPWYDAAALVASGAVGIGVADTLFFRALNLLGASRSAVVECGYTPAVVFFSVLFLGETLATSDVIGALLIIGSIFLAVEVGEGESGYSLEGLVLGVLSVVLMAWAVVMVKPLFEIYPVIWSTTLRMVGGLLGLALWVCVRPGAWKEVTAAFKPNRGWRHALPGSIVGTYLALMCWVAGFKYGTASVTAILNQTATIITVVLAAVFLKETLSRRQVGGALVAMAGCILVLVG